METKTSLRFEGTCWRCQGRLTGNGTDRPWRHDVGPADRHQAMPTGTLRQI